MCNIDSLCKTHCLFVGKLQPSATMLCHRAFFLLKTRVPVHVKELAKVLGKYEWRGGETHERTLSKCAAGNEEL